MPLIVGGRPVCRFVADKHVPAGERNASGCRLPPPLYDEFRKWRETWDENEKDPELPESFSRISRLRTIKGA
jgi:hypothetical protein